MLEMFLIALFCAIWQFFASNDIGYTISDTLGQPVLVGGILGILMGDIQKGLLIGGSLQLLYLGVIYPGGTVPACASTAALVAIPVALRTGLDPKAAVVLAVPFGILGALLWNLKYSFNSFIVAKADKAIADNNFSKIPLYGKYYPLVLAFIIFSIPIFFCNILAPSLVAQFIENIPQWAMHGIEVSGGLLPAIGFAIAIYTLGNKLTMPFFIIGYFLVIYLKLPIMAVAIFGTAIAFVYLYMTNNQKIGV